jgi:hypothetical protein
MHSLCTSYSFTLSIIHLHTTPPRSPPPPTIATTVHTRCTLPPRLILDLPMRHALPEILFPLPIHTDRPTPTPHPLLLPHKALPSLSPPTPPSIHTLFAKPFLSPTDSAKIRTHRPRLLPFRRPRGRWPFHKLIRPRILPGQLLLEPPQRRFRQDFDALTFSVLQFPEYVRIAGFARLCAVVDDESVVVGKGAAFVDAAVRDPGAVEAETCPDGGVDVFVCLAEGAVGAAAIEGVDGVVDAWCAVLMLELVQSFPSTSTLFSHMSLSTRKMR